MDCRAPSLALAKQGQQDECLVTGQDSRRALQQHSVPCHYWLGDDDDDADDGKDSMSETSWLGQEDTPDAQRHLSTSEEESWERERRELEASKVRHLRAMQEQKQLDCSVELLLRKLGSLNSEPSPVSTAPDGDESLPSSSDGEGSDSEVDSRRAGSINSGGDDTDLVLSGMQAQRKAAIEQLSRAGVNMYPASLEKLEVMKFVEKARHTVESESSFADRVMHAGAAGPVQGTSLAAPEGSSSASACTEMKPRPTSDFSLQLASRSCEQQFEPLETASAEETASAAAEGRNTGLHSAVENEEDSERCLETAAPFSSVCHPGEVPSWLCGAAWRGWRLRSTAQGQLFYHHETSGSSQWTAPPDLAQLLGEWVQRMDDSGNSFWWNSVANMSFWHDPRNTFTIFQAATSDDIYFAQLYVLAGGSVDALNEKGCSALHISCACGSSRIAQFLLERKASPNICDLGGSRALHYACRYGVSAAVCLLLQSGAHVNAPDAAGDSPLHLAVESQCADSVHQLLRWRADVTYRSPKHGLRTAAELAMNRGAPQVVAILTSYANKAHTLGRSSRESHQSTSAPSNQPCRAAFLPPPRQEPPVAEDSPHALRPLVCAVKRLTKHLLRADAARTDAWQRGRGVPVLEAEVASWRRLLKLLARAPRSALHLVGDARIHLGRGKTGEDRDRMRPSDDDVGLP
eukprot:TRINITY_DN92897_c0_g1_i1.p1 TRINITY_DN92897_c0_g1~~TRINITY_DN92897_c0_g1_i1.p1  ORF type:complete len:689 (+),score=139.79 TRINITY_DN92897_c0_g1_i1:54-2120(+)